jgi:hypothetical protein
LGIHHIVLIGEVSGTSAYSFDITVEAAKNGPAGLALTGSTPLGALLLAFLFALLAAVLLLAAKMRRRRHS